MRRQREAAAAAGPPASSLAPVHVPDEVGTPRERRSRVYARRARTIFFVLAEITLAGLLAAASGPALVSLTAPPSVTIHLDGPSAYEILVDDPPVTITVTADWRTLTRRVSKRTLLASRGVWLGMYLADWDRLPAPLREEGLDRMLERYGAVIDDPAVWRQMNVFEWDMVPQPIRAMAYMNMIRDWTWHYRLADRTEPHQPDVAAIVQAIALSESWFEHRATNANGDDGLDIGLGQLSPYARARLPKLFSRGLADFEMTEADYYRPLRATRALTYWFGLMLEEADGDVELAVRAYNQGMSRARRGEGLDYLDDVTRRVGQYILGASGSPAWRYLRTRNAEMKRLDPVLDP